MLKPVLRRILAPVLPGWLDEARRIVQGRHIAELLTLAADGNHLRAAFNAGAGEGGYSPLLLGLKGVETVIESDYSFRSGPPRRIDPKQLFFCASLTDLPLSPRTVDIVLCTEVLEHIEDDGKALDEITQILVPGGWLLISVPTPPAPFDPAHVREGYRSDQLGQLLKERGFEIVETRFCMYFWFQFLYRNWRRLPWWPRLVVQVLAWLDRFLPLGKPCDLIILARLSGLPPVG